jgi:3-hydroxyisobutyrate dehydrogenase-like beta-hydroxyacid dehydrogenase
MRVGVIGLGAMGGGITKNLLKKSFSVAVRDLREEAVEQLVKEGAKAAGPI